MFNAKEFAEITLPAIITEHTTKVYSKDCAIINIYVPKAWKSLKTLYQLPVYHQTDSFIHIYVNYDLQVVMELEIFVGKDTDCVGILKQYEGKSAWKTKQIS